MQGIIIIWQVFHLTLLCQETSKKMSKESDKNVLNELQSLLPFNFISSYIFQGERPSCLKINKITLILFAVKMSNIVFLYLG